MDKQNYLNPDTRIIEFLPGHHLLDIVTSKPTGTGDDWTLVED